MSLHENTRASGLGVFDSLGDTTTIIDICAECLQQQLRLYFHDFFEARQFIVDTRRLVKALNLWKERVEHIWNRWDRPDSDVLEGLARMPHYPETNLKKYMDGWILDNDEEPPDGFFFDICRFSKFLLMDKRRRPTEPFYKCVHPYDTENIVCYLNLFVTARQVERAEINLSLIGRRIYD